MPFATSAPQARFLAELIKEVPFLGGAWSGRQHHGVETIGWGSDVEQEPATDLLPGLCQAVLPGKVPPPPRLG